jgi:hypothetical protein
MKTTSRRFTAVVGAAILHAASLGMSTPAAEGQCLSITQDLNSINGADIVIARFDPALGTLVSVRVEYTSVISVFMTALVPIADSYKAVSCGWQLTTFPGQSNPRMDSFLTCVNFSTLANSQWVNGLSVSGFSYSGDVTVTGTGLNVYQGTTNPRLLVPVQPISDIRVYPSLPSQVCPALPLPGFSPCTNVPAGAVSATTDFTRSVSARVTYKYSVLPVNVTQPPQPARACAGGAASFMVTAAGPGPFTYRWRKNNAPINIVSNPSAATPTLMIMNVQASDVGSYSCAVSDGCGGLVSSAADLTIRQSCSLADVTGLGGPSAGDCGDGALTSDDVVAFLSAFFASQPKADIASLGGRIGGDGLYTIDDVIAFLTAFFAGCP